MKKNDKDIEIVFEDGHVPYKGNKSKSGKPSKKDAKEPGKFKQKWRKLKKWQRVIIIIVAVIVALALIGCGVVYGIWGGFQNNIDKNNLGISDDISNKYGNTGITNIALFGVDTRDENSFSGRSDSIMIVSIDKANNTIKLVSVLRDSYVAIDGHGSQKITHAYAYGGAELAIKTLNQNYNMNITDYATINFFKLADAIDILGGVDLEITEDERDELNNIGDDGNPDFKYVEDYGMVHLTGEQASVYSRIRKRDSDNARVNRQKAIIECLIAKAKAISPTKYADLVKAGMSLCETSLSVSEVLSFAPMLANPINIETMVVPGDEDNAIGGTYDGAWVWRYDLQAAADRIHLFIYGEVPETPATTKKNQNTANTTKKSSSSTTTSKTTSSNSGSGSGSGGNNNKETTTHIATTTTSVAEITTSATTTKPTTAVPETQTSVTKDNENIDSEQ